MNWYKKAQHTRPGELPMDLDNFRAKLEYWGMPEEWGRIIDQWPLIDLAKSPDLSLVDIRHVQSIVDHFAEKHLPNLREALLYIKDPCDGFARDFYLPVEQEAQFDNEFSVLDNDVWEGVQGLAQRSEIQNQQFIESLYSLALAATKMNIQKKFVQSVSNGRFFVRVYGQNQAFGGYEEGGWWTNVNSLVEEREVQGLQQACQLRTQLNQYYENYSGDSFLDDMANSGTVKDLYNDPENQSGGLGDMDMGDNYEGMSIPKGWTPSQYERIEARVEMSPEPLEDISGEVPHYE